MKVVDVIVPVYKGLEETKECVESALASLPTLISQLVVINDCSPDASVTEYLRIRSKSAPFLLIENTENLGFVATANLGMSLNPDHDVLLLNSDVQVANDWLERMVNAAYSDRSIGSVTPFSNNATICSFPNFCEDNSLFENYSVATLDRVCAEANAPTSFVDVPTGVGFCMFIKRSCLDEVGLFDHETFGKGYGEENDWSRRAIIAGWRNIHLMNVFVFHKGAVSFASEQSVRKDKAMALLHRKHPNYQTEVHRFISADPAKTYRIKFLLSLIAQDSRPKVLSIDHGLGGGVVQHAEELAMFVEGDALFLRLQPCGERMVKLSFSLKTNIKDSLVFSIDNQYEDFLLFCRFLAIGHIHFHHTSGLPSRLLQLSKDLGCGYDITIHDYYFVNGNPTLTDRNAVYCGDAPDRDPLCAEYCPIPVSATLWRERLRGFLGQAERMIFPSNDAYNRFVKDFSLKNTTVAWHPDSELHTGFPSPSFKFSKGSSRNLRVLVVGSVSRMKGADVLEMVADALAEHDVEFHLLGYAYRPLSKNVISYGPYLLDEVDSKLLEIKPDVAWFPAQWPETYSYTLSIALRAGLPVVVPDIGAFGERVAGREYSVIQPWDMSIDAWKKFWLGVVNSGNLETNPKSKVVKNTYLSFYRDEYVKSDWYKQSKGVVNIELIKRCLRAEATGNLARREMVLKRLWKIREHSIFGKFAALIPFKVQRYIKRKLSQKPIHDVVQ